MHDRNEVLYFRLLAEHIEEMLPIVYTPTIGKAIEEYSHWYDRPRGIYLSIDDPEDMEQALAQLGHGPDDVDLIVATDAEGILASATKVSVRRDHGRKASRIHRSCRDSPSPRAPGHSRRRYRQYGTS